MHAAAHQLDANLVFEIADLAAEGRLRRVQPFLGRKRQASLLGDRDEIAKVPYPDPILPRLRGIARSSHIVPKPQPSRSTRSANHFRARPGLHCCGRQDVVLRATISLYVSVINLLSHW